LSERTTVLAVTKDPLIVDATRYGFPDDVEVLLAGDARDAYRLLKKIVPAAALIDIHTGSAGGFAVSRDMAEDPRLQSVPIMMRLEREQDLWLARQARAQIIRVKPVETSDLVGDLMSLVEKAPAEAS
jgi:DNA-binding response OmpR family regulator